MNWIDILIIFIVIIGAGIGLVVGLFRAIILLASLILSTILASQFYIQAGRFIEGFIHSTAPARVVSFIIIFGSSFAVFTILGLLAYHLVTTLKLGFVDRIGGALFGMIVSLLFISLCAILLTKYSFATSCKLFKESMLVPYCLQATKFVTNLLPREFSDTISEFSISVKT